MTRRPIAGIGAVRGVSAVRECVGTGTMRRAGVGSVGGENLSEKRERQKQEARVRALPLTGSGMCRRAMCSGRARYVQHARCLSDGGLTSGISGERSESAACRG